jgi:L-fuculose-phosphate aldolase
MKQSQLKDEIIRIGKLLWDKGLATGFNGNISARVDENSLLITASGTSLGFLNQEDLVTINLSGEVVSQGKASSEKLLHTEIYKCFPNVQAIVHTHSTYTNGFFLKNDSFVPKTFEAKFYLGQIKSIDQNTPTVTDVKAVLDELKSNNIVVLRNHGVVAMGTDLFQAFVLVQELEEQVKMDLVSVHYSKMDERLPLKQGSHSPAAAEQIAEKKYKLFSKEQIDQIVNLVNGDAQMKELGVKTAMNMDLAVCLQETGDVYSFEFENGRIAKTGNDSQAEFLITANEAVWRSVFNGEIDPFVATTQKKMNLRGDFARISKWYAPCSRIFQIFRKVPVE